MSTSTNPQYDNFIDDLVNPALADYEKEGAEGVKARIDGLSWAAKQAFKLMLSEQIKVEGDPERLAKLQAVAELT